MLGYFRAFSFFLIWAAIAVTSHYFISHKIFNNCNLEQINVSTVAETSTDPFIVFDDSNNTIFQSANGYVIYKDENRVTNNIEDFTLLANKIQSTLENDYTKELHITGRYLKSEINTENASSIGAARAELIKQEFIKSNIDPARIKTNDEADKFSFRNNDSYSNGINLKISTLPQAVIDNIELQITDQTIYPEFENNQLISSSISQDKINTVQQYLTNYPDKFITIIGHTDNVGYYENNLIISGIRANSIKDYFINAGINSSKIKTISKGESEPIADKKTIVGRKINSRIEIKIN